MSLLVSSSAASAPFTTFRSKTSSTRAAAAGRLLVAAAQQQQAAAVQQWRLVPTAAVALASSLACTPTALAAVDPAAVQVVYELAALDSKTAGALSLVLKPTLSIASLLMIVRIVMSWYPEIDGKTMPWTIAYTPTGAWGIV